MPWASGERMARSVAARPPVGSVADGVRRRTRFWSSGSVGDAGSGVIIVFDNRVCDGVFATAMSHEGLGFSLFPVEDRFKSPL